MTRAHTGKSTATLLAATLAFSLPAVTAAASAAPSESASPTTWSAGRSAHLGTLNAVSCMSFRCYAAGTSGRSVNALIKWSYRNTWFAMASQPAGTSSAFSSISCTFLTDCVAVGWYEKAPNPTPYALIETWNGLRWSIVPGASSLGGGFRSVSCVTPTSCVAVGVARTGGGAIAARSDGVRWDLTSLPVLPFGLTTNLRAVSCVSTTRCVAVGDASYGSVSEALVETWDGTRWSVVDSPTLGSRHDRRLLAVSCVSETSCFAVGRSGFDPGTGSPLIERWDGLRWSVMHHPTYGRPYFANSLTGVSCVSATSCVAVGTARNTDVLSELILQDVIETWDGTQWSITRAPPGPSVFSALNGVSCNPEHCAAVGGSFSNGFVAHTFTLSGNVPRRIVTVAWRGTAKDRLQRVAASLHVTPARAQKLAVYFVAYILGFGMRAAAPAALTRVAAPATAGATYTTVWAQSEFGVLDLVRMNFGPSSAEATQFAVGFFASYLAID